MKHEDYISALCAKASYQNSALRGIVKYLTMVIVYLSIIHLLHQISIIAIRFDIFAATEVYKLEKVNEQAHRVVLNDYSSSYRNLLNKVSKPTLNVSRLKAIAIEAYKCKANESPDYSDVMLNPLTKVYNLRGGPHATGPY